LNLRPLRPERGTTGRCRTAEHARGRSEHDSGASGSSSAVRWAWVCSFFVPSPTFSAFAWAVAHQSNKELRATPSWADLARLFLRVIGTLGSGVLIARAISRCRQCSCVQDIPRSSPRTAAPSPRGRRSCCRRRSSARRPARPRALPLPPPGPEAGTPLAEARRRGCPRPRLPARLRRSPPAHRRRS
jgi:hypothetical protein